MVPLLVFGGEEACFSRRLQCFFFCIFFVINTLKLYYNSVWWSMFPYHFPYFAWRAAFSLHHLVFVFIFCYLLDSFITSILICASMHMGHSHVLIWLWQRHVQNLLQGDCRGNLCVSFIVFCLFHSNHSFIFFAVLYLAMNFLRAFQLDQFCG